METFNLRGELLLALRAPKYKLTKQKIPQFCCPRHEDSTPSAWIADNAWGCHACGFSASLYALAEELGVEVPHRAKGLTVADYADRKGFSYSKLTEWGVRDATGRYGQPVVVIPCYDADGKVIRERIRLTNKTIWGEGSGTCLYGLNVLAKAPAGRPVILVEGESDCHAGWHKGFCVIGVPGASLWKSEYAPLFAGREVYIWQEPDGASEKMAAKITADLPQARLIIAELNGAKDIAELFTLTGDGFKAALQQRMANAYPAGHIPPAITFDAVLGGTLEAIRKEKLLPIDAVPTPFPSWNIRCGDEGGAVGLARGWHITLAGKTGLGKSLVALNIAAEAVRTGESVCFVSLEMSLAQLATRYLAIMSGLPVFRMEHGKSLDLEQHIAAERVVQEVFDATGGVLRVNRNNLSDLDKITEAILYEWEYHGCKFVIVDYMQLAYVKAARSDLDRMTAVSSAIRRIAAEHKLVTIGLSQFNRETSNDRDNPPSPQGLHGGSPLENDSHQVLLLNHTSYQMDPETRTARTELMLAKNRHGAQVNFPVLMNYHTLRVSEVGGTPPPAPPIAAPRAPRDAGEAWEPDSEAIVDLSFDPPEDESTDAAA